MTHRSTNSNILAAIDGLLALVITVAAVVYTHSGVAAFHNVSARQIGFIDAVFGMFFIIFWQYCFSVLKLYDRFATIPSRMTAIFKGVAIMTFPVMIHLRVFHPHLLTARAVIFSAVALFAYEVDRIGFREFLMDRIARRNPQHVLIIGSGRRAGKAWREIRTRFHSSTKVFGFVDDREPSEMAPDIADRYLGRIDDLETLLLRNAVDILLIAMPIQSCYPEMQRAVTIAESVGVKIIYLQDIYATRQRDESPNRSLFQDLFPQHEHYVMQLAVKRTIDIVLSFSGLLILSPLLILIALSIRLTSRGPALFFQERYGFKRRTFRMVKFRSMVVDAESQMARLEVHNEASGPIFKMKNDPRVTPLGRILRSTSLDELPQLWNVLLGDMSLVGPRPMSVRDVLLFDEAALMRRFSVQPGITGLWQVNGRSNVSFAEWMELDIRYIEEWSLFLDAQILARTITAVLKRSGAV